MYFIFNSYLDMEIQRHNYSNAKRIYYRSIHACGWCQSLYMYAYGELRVMFDEDEWKTIEAIIIDRGFTIIK